MKMREMCSQRIRRFLAAYWTDWRYPASGFCILHLLIFMESYLGLGPGLEIVWGPLFALNWIYFLLRSFAGRWFFTAFFCCNVLLVGGCCKFRSWTSLPENVQMEHLEYSILTMGKYSEWIPMGAHDIGFTHYTGICTAATVTCTVSEPAFLWFCLRNRYKVRSDRADVNEYTGKTGEAQYFGGEVMGPRFYARVTRAETGAGLRLFYNRDTGRMYLDFSSN